MADEFSSIVPAAVLPLVVEDWFVDFERGAPRGDLQSTTAREVIKHGVMP